VWYTHVMASLTTGFTAPPKEERTPSSQAVVIATTTTGSLLAANAARTAAYIQNRGNRDVFVAYGATATAATGVLIPGGGTFFEENYTGEFSVLADQGSQDVFVAEFI